MDIRELRIGNYIKLMLNDEDFKLIQVTLNDLEVIDNKKGIFEPIPITEEWLLKFGFEKTPLGYFKKDGIILVVEDFYYECLLGSVAKILKYIHQLQNLYFALTGKELEIKE